MQYFTQSNIDKQDKSKNNPDKIFIPFNAGRQISGDAQSFGSGQPAAKEIELFSTVSTGIAEGKISTTGGDNMYTVDGTTGATLRTITNPAGIKFQDPTDSASFIQIYTNQSTPITPGGGNGDMYEGFRISEDNNTGQDFYFGAGDWSGLTVFTDLRVTGNIYSDGINIVPGTVLGVVTPVAAVVPNKIGEFYIDTVAKLAYIAVGTLNTDWTQI